MNVSISIEEWYANPPAPSCGHPVYPITDGMGGVLAGCYFCEICSKEQKKEGEMNVDDKVTK